VGEILFHAIEVYLTPGSQCTRHPGVGQLIFAIKEKAEYTGVFLPFNHYQN